MSAVAERAPVPARKRFSGAGVLEALRSVFVERLGDFPSGLDRELRCLTWCAKWEPEALDSEAYYSYAVMERVILDRIQRAKKQTLDLGHPWEGNVDFSAGGDSFKIDNVGSGNLYVYFSFQDGDNLKEASASINENANEMIMFSSYCQDSLTWETTVAVELTRLDGGKIEHRISTSKN